MRVAIYCRVPLSGHEALDAQMARIRSFIGKNKYEVVEAFVEKKDDRARMVMQCMLAHTKNGLFDAVLVTDLNKLSRNLDELILIVRKLHENGVNVLTTDSSIIPFDVLLSMATPFERFS